LGNFFLPLQLGAKDVAFPRLNLLSLWLFGFGSVFFIVVLFQQQIDTGWTFYTPYSTQTGGAVLWATAGVFIAGFSSILTGLNFIVTIHKMRAPGMTWRRLPLFLWALYATSIIQVLATPVIGITMLLLIMERTLGIGIFDPALGGDPILYQHFFWFYSHPVVYVMILPGFGIVSELITSHSRKNIFGYNAIAVSSVAIAVIGFLVWGHHMFVSGQSGLAATIFSFLTFAVAVPTAIKVFSWIATMYKGSIELNTPMLYMLSFLFLFSIGGLTGIFLGAIATDIHLHDTYFVVAHFHYVMMGGTLIAFIGGLFHWWPKMFGKMYHETLGKISAWLVFIGFNVTFMSQFVIGTNGMPRRYAHYVEKYELGHQISTVGSWVLGLGLFIAAISLGLAFFRKDKAPKNPWRAVTLEWETESPPIQHNFEGQPVCNRGPYEFPEIDPSMGSKH
jgi:cytochrome c oxidase subunit 1